MLVAAPHITPNFAHINALFIQPSPYCARNCPGCYAKTFKGALMYPVRELLKHINVPAASEAPKPLLANQVTFAFDRLPINYGEDGADYYGYIQEMGAAFLQMKKTGRLGEWHGTTHSLDDFLMYATQTERFIYQSGQGVDPAHKLLDVLSISSMDIATADQIPNLKKYVANHINWNCTIFPGHKLEKIQKDFELIAGEVDSVYLVLHKPSTGTHIDVASWAAHLEMRQFVQTLPEAIRKKVMTDGCVHDSAKYLKTGYGCSSNVSRFQVWPDGSVTGCPYKQSPTTASANSFNALLKNIYDASKVYEFERCKIPHQLDPNNQRVNPRNYLEIID